MKSEQPSIILAPAATAIPGRNALLLRQSVLAAAYFISALLALVLTGEPGRVASVWIANALVVTVLLKKPASAWLGWLVAGLLGNLAANLLTGDAPLPALLLGLCNTIEIVLVCVLTSFGNKREETDLTEFKFLARFLFVGVLIGSAVASYLASVTVSAFYGIPIRPVFLTWFRSDALGLLITAPLLAGVTGREIKAAISLAKKWETYGLMVLAPAITFLALAWMPHQIIMLLVLVTVAASVRLGYVGGAIVTFLMTISGIISIVFFQGQIEQNAPIKTQIEWLQIFAFINVLVALPNSALLRVSRNNEEKYRLLSERMADVIWTLDLQTMRLTYISPSVMAMRGYSPEEARAQSLEEILTPESMLLVQTLLPQRIAALMCGDSRMKTQTNELFQYRKDGTVVETEVVTTLETDAHGIPVSVIGVSRDITERKRTEAALRQREDLHRLLVENTLFPVVIVSHEDDRVLFSNELASSFFEVAGPAVGQFAPDFHCDPQVYARLKARLKAGEMPVTFEARMRTATGKTKEVVISSTCLEYNGIPAHISVSVDLTARVAAEQALRANEQKYRTLYETMAQGVFYQDATGRILSVNPAASHIFGIPVEDFLSGAAEHTAFEWTHEDGSPFPVESQPPAMALKTGLPVGSMVAGLRHAGLKAIRWLVLNSVPQFSVGPDRPSGVVTTINDITESKHAEDALRASEERYREIIDGQGEGLAITDLDDAFVFSNPAADKIFGVARGGMIGRRVGDFVSASPLALVKEQTAVLKAGQSSSHEIEIHRPDSSIRVIQLTATPRRDNSGAVIGTFGIFRDVTDLRKAEEERRRYYQRYAAMLETTKDGFWQTSLDGRLLEVNDAYCQMSGYSRAELLNMSIADVEAQETPQAVREHLRRLKSMTAEHFESSHRAKDGHTYPVEISLTRLADIGVQMVFVRDVTARKQSEAVLRDSEARYRIIFEQAGDYVFVLHRETDGMLTFLDMNEAAWRGHGYTRDELIGQPLTLIDPNLSKESLAIILPQIEEKGSALFTARHRRKDGTFLDVEVRARMIQWGRTSVFVSVERDISDRIAAEEEIRKLSRAVKQSTSGILITDCRGVIEYVNDSLTRMTGYSHSDLVGKRPSILKSGQMRPELYEELWKTILAGKEWRGEFQNRRKDGSLFWDTTAITPLLDMDGNITNFLAIKDDISAQKRSAEERELLEQQFRQAQKMEAIGHMAGGVAHDFNNILTAISGHSELAYLQLRKDDPIQIHVQEILRGSERAANLTRQLLAFSRKQVIEPQVVDLNYIVNDLKRMLNRIIGENVHLNSTLAEGLWRIYTDPGQIEQMIVNLAVNARDAMPKGGDLLMSTYNEMLDERYCATHLEATPGAYAVLEVKDSGVGMSEDVKMRIFEPFFTTKPKGMGTGLGLATVYGIVKQAGGHIWVDSTLGHGTTFRIYLPRTTEKPVGKAIDAEDLDALHGTETILVIEDSDATRRTIIDGLSYFGYRVIAAESGEEALTICRDKTEKIHLVLSDVILPGITGIDLAPKIREILPMVRMLLMSGYTDTSVVPTQDLPFIQKPFQIRSLARKIRSILSGTGSRDHLA